MKPDIINDAAKEKERQQLRVCRLVCHLITFVQQFTKLLVFIIGLFEIS